MRDFTSEQLISMGTWLAGGVILHDAVIAPVTVLLGVVAARLLPGHTRSVAAIAFLVWATLTVTFVNVLSGQGGKPDNDTVLHRPYGLSWLILTIVSWSRRCRWPADTLAPCKSPWMMGRPIHRARPTT